MQDITETVYSGFQSAYQTISNIGVKNFLLLTAAATAASVAGSYVAEVIERRRYNRKQLLAALQVFSPERLLEVLSKEREYNAKLLELVEKIKIELGCPRTLERIISK